MDIFTSTKTFKPEVRNVGSNYNANRFLGNYNGDAVVDEIEVNDKGVFITLSLTNLPGKVTVDTYMANNSATPAIFVSRIVSALASAGVDIDINKERSTKECLELVQKHLKGKTVSINQYRVNNREFPKMFYRVPEKETL